MMYVVVCRCPASAGVAAAVSLQAGPESTEPELWRDGPRGAGPPTPAVSGPGHHCLPEPTVQCAARCAKLHPPITTSVYPYQRTTLSLLGLSPKQAELAIYLSIYLAVFSQWTKLGIILGARSP